MLQLVGLLGFDSFVAISGHIWIRLDLHLDQIWIDLTFWLSCPYLDWDSLFASQLYKSLLIPILLGFISSNDILSVE